MRTYRKLMLWFLVIAALVLLWNTDRFLAVNAPVEAEVLVLESWFWSSPAVLEAADLALKGQVSRFIVAGVPEGDPSQPVCTATLAANRLREAGVPDAKIVVISVPDRGRHRTFGTAQAVAVWIAESGRDIRAVNVFTMGVHARKSRILFRKALGPDIRVGVIAGTESTYDPRFWCFSRRGIYCVVRKMAGYLYAVAYRPAR